jgi:hypothetical protein
MFGSVPVFPGACLSTMDLKRSALGGPDRESRSRSRRGSWRKGRLVSRDRSSARESRRGRREDDPVVRSSTPDLRRRRPSVERLSLSTRQGNPASLAWPAYNHNIRRFLLRRFPYNVVHRVWEPPHPGRCPRPSSTRVWRWQSFTPVDEFDQSADTTGSGSDVGSKADRRGQCVCLGFPRHTKNARTIGRFVVEAAGSRQASD